MEEMEEEANKWRNFIENFYNNSISVKPENIIFSKGIIDVVAVENPILEGHVRLKLNKNLKIKKKKKFTKKKKGHSKKR